MIVWIIGLSGSGKSTLAIEVVKKIAGFLERSNEVYHEI